MNWSPIFLSIQVTLVATVGILIIGLAFALFLARTRTRAKILIETLINLPLVLPPSVVGYYLLITLGRDGPLVRWFDLNLVFTWQAAAIAAIVVALPLLVHSPKAALDSVDPVVEIGARTWRIWRHTDGRRK